MSDTHKLTPFGVIVAEIGEAAALRVFNALELAARREHPGFSCPVIVFNGRGGVFAALGNDGKDDDDEGPKPFGFTSALEGKEDDDE